MLLHQPELHFCEQIYINYEECKGEGEKKSIINIYIVSVW